MLDDTGNAPFLSCTADWHDLVSHCISFSKANLHPKLPVFWSLGISNCSTLARDTTSKKNSAVNQTELKPSNIQEFWCLILLSAAQHCAPQACSAWRRGTQASLSTDNSLSTAAWVSLRVNLLSSSTQPNVEALVRNWASRATLQVLSAGGPVPMPGRLLLTATACSLLSSGSQRCYREMTGMQCLALLTLIISNTTPSCLICLTHSHSASVQLSQEYGKVVIREHSWKCRFLFIYYSPRIVK